MARILRPALDDARSANRSWDTDGPVVQHERRSPGFTLIELLILIAIIIMLLALLLPAVSKTRESGRVAQCVNHLLELGKATLACEQRKQRFPGWMYNANGTTLSWLSQLLSDLGRAPLYDAVIAGAQPNITVDVMMCPTDAHSQAGPWASYVCSIGQQGDDPAKGVFLDMVTDPDMKVSLQYVTRFDGAATTVLASEHTGTGYWYQYTGVSSMTWNKKPESSHDGGANVLFADGHVQFLSNETLDDDNEAVSGDIDSIVWKLLCAPNDSGAGLTGSLTEEMLNQ